MPTGSVSMVCQASGGFGLTLVANPDTTGPGENLTLRGGGSGQPVRNYFSGNADNANQSNVWIGDSAYTNSTTTVYANHFVVGNASTVAPGAGAAAIGNAANAAGDGSLAFGTNAVAGVTGNAAITNGVAIGTSAQATGQSATAVGDSAVASGASSIAIGRQTSVSGAGGIALGMSATASAAQGVAIGQGATAGNANSVALGAGSVTAAPSGTGWRTGSPVPTATVSVGTTSLTRRITNVADGSAATDAATIAQLQTAATDLGTALTSGLGGGAAYNPSTGVFTPPQYQIGGTTYTNVGAALTAENTIVNTGFNTTAAALGGGSTYAPATGVSMPVYTVDNGTGTANTTVSGVGGAVTNLDQRIVALQTGRAGLVQQNQTTRALTVGAATDGTSVSFAGTAGTRTLTGVTAGALSVTSTDAVNGSQLFATNQQMAVNTANIAGNTTAINNINNGAGIKYFHANSTLADSQAIGTNSVAIGPNAVASNAGDIALGNGSTTSAAVATTGTTIGGVAYSFAGTAPTSTLSVGAVGAERTITNVAAGRLGATSTDAINGSQLFATNQAVASNAANTSAYLGGGANVSAGTAPSYTVRGTTYNNVGSALGAVDSNLTNIANGAAGVVQRTINANETVLVASGGTAAAPGAAQKLTNLAAGTLSVTSTDAVNGSQLFATNQQMAVNTTNIAGNTAAINNINNGAGIKYFHANSTLADSQAIGTNSVAIGPNAVASNAGDIALGNGSTTSAAVATTGTTIGGIAYSFAGTAPTSTLSVGAVGAERTITNVAAGRLSGTSTDAINGSQLFATNQAVASNAANTNAYLGGGANVSTGTAPSYTVQGGTYNNVGSALGAVDTNLTTLNNSIANGTAGVVQRTANANETVLVASGGTAAAPGAAQKLTNLAAGALSATSTEAVNGSQLFATNSQVTQNTTDIASLGGRMTTAEGNVTNLGNTLTGIAGDTSTAYTDANGDGIRYARTNETGLAQADAFAQGVGSTALGYQATASAGNAVAIGRGAQASIAGALALGTGSVADRALAPATGTIPAGLGFVPYNTADGTLLGAVSVGNAASSERRQITNVADGTDAQDAVTIRQLAGAIGSISNTPTQYFHANSSAPDSLSVGAESIAVGPATVVNGDNGIGIGNGAIVGQTAPGGTAIGQNAQVSQADALAFGTNSLANGIQSIAIGAGANASFSGSVALGAGATTSVGSRTGYTAYGLAAPTNSAGEVSMGSAGTERQVTNVAAGSAATDAVNVGQLNQVAQNTATSLGGGAAYDPATGSYTAPTYAVGGASYNNVGDALGAQNTQISDLGNTIADINNGAGIKYFHANSADPDSQAIGANSVAIGPNAIANNAGDIALGSGSTSSTAVATTGTTIGSTAYTFAGTAPTSTLSVGAAGAERTITNVAAGRLDATSTDAINGSQLFATNQAIATTASDVSAYLGGGTNALTRTAPSYTVQGGTYNNVGSALGAVDTGLTNIVNGAAGVVQRTANANETALVASGGTAAAPGAAQKLTNLAAGALSATSTEAVNGSQLFATNQQVAQNTSDIADNATAITNLGNTVNNINNGGGIKYFRANSTDPDSQAFGANAVAIGPNAVANNTGDVALGSGSTTAAAVGTSGTTINGTAYAFAGAAPASTVSVGSAGAERTVTNVAAGRVDASSTDAVNGSQLFATNQAVDGLGAQVTSLGNTVTTIGNTLDSINNGAGIKYFHANSADPDSQAVGTNSVAIGPNAVASNAGDIALGNGSTTSAAVATTGTTIGGVAYSFAGTAPTSTLSVGAVGAERTITNVAAGRLSGTSTDAVNGSQLFATNSQVTQNTSDIAGLGGRMITAEGNITTLGNTLSNIAGDTSTAYTDANGDGIRYARSNETGLARADAFAQGVGSTALGYQAMASAGNAVAMGRGARATIDGSLALGAGSVADRALAPVTGTIPAGVGFIPYNTADATLLGSLSIGDATSGAYRQITNVADGTDAQDAATIRQLAGALGSVTVTNTRYFHANSSVGDSLAIGLDSIAMGPATVVNGDNGIGIGNGAIVGQTAPGGTAIGQNAQVSQADALAFGTNSLADGIQSIAIGAGANASFSGSVALGAGATTSVGSRTGYTGYGIAAPLNSAGEVSVGSAGAERQVTNVAAGSAATDAVNVGQLNQVAQNTATALGGGASYDPATGSYTAPTYAVGGASYNNVGDALGAQNTQIDNLGNRVTNVEGSVAAVTSNVSNLGNSMAAGLGGSSSYDPSTGSVTTALSVGGTNYSNVNDALTAINQTAGAGWNIQANGGPATNVPSNGTLNVTGASNTVVTLNGNQLQVGVVDNPIFAGLVTANGGLAVGANSSVDMGGNVVRNVAAGAVDAASTDAVNGAQLHQVQQVADNSVQYDAGGNSVTFNPGGEAAVLHNVAAGVAPTDAVNVGQLNQGLASTLMQANEYTDTRIATIRYDLSKVRRDANAGTAGALAAAGLPQAFEPGRGMLSFGAGTYRGQSAFALGLSRVMGDGQTVVKAGAAYDTQQNVGANVGIGFQF